MVKFLSGVVTFLVIGTCAMAQTAFPCGWQARADNIVEPWDQHTRTFANDAVRITLLDVAEPAAAAYYLMILHPPLEGLDLRTCTTVGMTTDLGYAFMDFAALAAGYDAASGLTLDMPATIYLPQQEFQNSTLLSITINQSTGAVTVDQRLGSE